jgi:ubiquinone/menaquinone biosynthesis C-methylase UbiE
MREIYSRGMTQARYDAVADLYIRGFDSTGDSVSLALLGLLGPVTGLRVLDVACGHGRASPANWRGAAPTWWASISPGT